MHSIHTHFHTHRADWAVCNNRWFWSLQMFVCVSIVNKDLLFVIIESYEWLVAQEAKQQHMQRRTVSVFMWFFLSPVNGQVGQSGFPLVVHKCLHLCGRGGHLEPACPLLPDIPVCGIWAVCLHVCVSLCLSLFDLTFECGISQSYLRKEQLNLTKRTNVMPIIIISSIYPYGWILSFKLGFELHPLIYCIHSPASALFSYLMDLPFVVMFLN